MMTRLTHPILRGLAVVLPLAATISLLAWAFIAVDGLLRPLFGAAGRIPGLGILALFSIATFVGIAALVPHTKAWIERSEQFLTRVPGVRLVYGPIKEFGDALLGEHRRFDKPVLVRLGGGFDAEVLGFVTRDDLESLGVKDKVAVYFPQSYNIGGNLLILPRERLTALDADSTAVMSFIISGGVAGLDARGTGALSSRAARLRAARNTRPRLRIAR